MDPLVILSKITMVLVSTISIYSFVLIVRILLSWFPNLDWSNPILSSVSSITDPYLNIFRGLIPPLGGIDLSAILAILALQFMQGLLENASRVAFNSGMSFYS
ncbi:MAG: YggT family protein [Prochlorococcus sp.]|jgi:YggT family protein